MARKVNYIEILQMIDRGEIENGDVIHRLNENSDEIENAYQYINGRLILLGQNYKEKLNDIHENNNLVKLLSLKFSVKDHKNCYEELTEINNTLNEILIKVRKGE